MNLSDPIYKNSHFRWSEALYLPQWQVYHNPSNLEKDNIIKSCQKLELVRDMFNKPLLIHVWIRPILNSPGNPMHGQDYNAFIGGAPNSEHKAGCAIDFHIGELSCDDVRAKLLPKLDEFDIRVEDKPSAAWVHIDIAKPRPNRYFKP